MAQAPDGDDTLTQDDAIKILEELLDAQNNAEFLGLKLNVKQRDVDAIINRYKDPKQQLLHIIKAFLQQTERPTWRAIVDALRSPAVGLTALAKTIESNHFPDAGITARVAGVTIREAFDCMPSHRVEASSTKTPQFTVQCIMKGKPPVAMRRGSAISDGRFAYFTSYDSRNLYQFEYSTEEWKELPECRYCNSGLAIINGELTTVGGTDFPQVTYELDVMTLKESQWVGKYPPMKIGRCYPEVVTTEDGSFHIVIGGECKSAWSKEWSDEIEIFNGRERKWHKATQLPTRLTYPSATISGNQLYVIGQHYFAYSCSLQVFSGEPITLIPIILTWNPLPPLPAEIECSTLGTLCRKLVLVGGAIGKLHYVKSIYHLMDGEWVKIGSMNVARANCLVVNKSLNKITILGGGRFLVGEKETECAEECIVKQ